jgi:NADPH-dependent 2,4-dienoyl-CoA reductase/sulfur reductase-like enzyme
MTRFTRRTVIATALAAPFVARAETGPGVIIVGGGFGGASAARALRRYGENLEITLIEPNETFVACPHSNLVIAGVRTIDSQQFGYKKIAAEGIRVVHAEVTGVDPTKRRVTLASGESRPYDRLILSPGIDIAWGALPGYDEAASARMPHAWKAGAQTVLLRQQLEAMPDGGTVVMSVPPNPYRCPPGPYERASLIAWYLRGAKPKSKLIVLDSKDTFSKQKLFQAGWARLYPNILRWVSQSDGGTVIGIDPATMTLKTDFETYKADVANVIPPQKAGRVAAVAGVADKSGWCPVDPITFESRLIPGVHVIGDAAIAGAMPKSAFAANAHAKVCALAVARLLEGAKPDEPRLINTCYSLLAQGYGISVGAVYRPVNGVLTEVPGSLGTSPLDAPDQFRYQEAVNADAWFETITHEAFG